MKFDAIILIVLGFPIRIGSYVAGVNPRLASIKSTTAQPFIDFNKNRQDLVEMTNHQNLVRTKSHQNLLWTTTSSNADSRIIFPSSSENSNKRSYSQMTREHPRERTALRAMPVKLFKTPTHAQHSRNSEYPFERDEDDYKPIWSN